ncbi:hypothetical protein, partial [Chryseobacterium sp.]|uniref:hypothetical protein n=1 Tax=Chryseobacterium sp. TaxID=1871047 RepID=UPI002FC78C0D
QFLAHTLFYYSFFKQALRVEIKLFCMWILFIFKENIFWIDALREAKRYRQFLPNFLIKECKYPTSIN